MSKAPMSVCRKLQELVLSVDFSQPAAIKLSVLQFPLVWKSVRFHSITQPLTKPQQIWAGTKANAGLKGIPYQIRYIPEYDWNPGIRGSNSIFQLNHSMMPIVAVDLSPFLPIIETSPAIQDLQNVANGTILLRCPGLSPGFTGDRAQLELFSIHATLGRWYIGETTQV